MTISDLRKEMMLSKKTDKEKSLILSLILDNALKNAKSDKNREAVDTDIEVAAKAMFKQAEQSKALGMNVDFEMEVLKEFMPKVISFEKTEQLIETIVEGLSERNIKNILGTLKARYPDVKIDMKIASEIAKRY